jgi:hypothetical protein
MIADLAQGVAVSLALVGTMAGEVPERPADPVAERRVLAWLVGGTCSIADVADLSAYDFTSRGRRIVWGLGHELLETRERGDLRLDADRSTVRALLGYLDSEAEASEAEGELWRLPYPPTIPAVEIALVAVLGRRWSVVDDAYRGADR